MSPILHARRGARACASALAMLVTSACHPPQPPPAPNLLAPVASSPVPDCGVRIDEPSLPDPTPPAVFDVPDSEVVVRISFDTSALTARLSKEVPPRVAAASNIDAGIAGKLAYRIDRSPFVVSLKDSRLFVSTHLTSRADVCKPLGPLGCVNYAHCTPEAQATASIPLSFGSSYRPGPATVGIRVTRPCRIGAIDATTRIQRGADAQARRIQQRINALLPSFADDAQLLWQAMGVHVPLGLDARLCIRPLHVVEGAPTQERSTVAIPLGVRGTVVIEPRQGERDDLGAIPPPRYEPELSPGLRLNVPIGVDLEAIDADLSRSVRDDQTEPSATRILSLRAQPDANALRLLVSITGPVCGVVAFRAIPAFDAASRRVRLTDVAPWPSELQRIAARGVTVDLNRIAEAIQSRATVSLPVDPFAIPNGLERAVELLSSDDGPEVVVKVDSVSVERVLVTHAGIAALVRAQGSAEVVLR